MKTVILVLLLSMPVMALTSHKHHKNHFETTMFPYGHASLVEQNTWVDEYGLYRFKTDKDLHRATVEGLLVSIQESQSLRISPRLPRDRRLIRPWVQPFLNEISQAYYLEFGKPLVLSSAVRTVKVQMRLLHINRAAAPAHGEKMSSHLAGSTVDFGKFNMTREQQQWMRDVIMGYALNGLVLALEERECFHIMIKPERQ